jgi:hypothetical protein
MRSLAHELMHHTQKCNGDFDNVQNMGEQGYAQADPHMRTWKFKHIKHLLCLEIGKTAQKVLFTTNIYKKEIKVQCLQKMEKSGN